MKSNDSSNLNKDFFFKNNLEDLSKEDIIDETFRRAENKNQGRSIKQKTKKKPFYKSGILLIIIALVCIGIVILSPWAYVKCDKENNNGSVDKIIFINYDKEDIGFDNNSQLITDIFESDNCSNSSCNYAGLDFNDLKITPKTIFYGFVILALIGLVFVIFQIIDKIYGFSIETFIIIHSAFSAVAMVISVYLFLLVLKLIGIYFLLLYNSKFFTAQNIVFVSPVAIFLILVLFNVISWEIRVISSNYKRFEQRINPKPSEKPFFTYKSGLEYNER